MGRGIATSLTLILLEVITSGISYRSGVLLTGVDDSPKSNGIECSACLSFLWMNLSGSERGDIN